MNRINVIGTSGSGKTTFSRQLSQAIRIPHVELDSVFWKDNWVESSREEMISNTFEKLNREQWIVDGNYSYVTQEIWNRTEIIVWLDTPKLWNLWAVSKRSVLRAFTREKLFGKNCRENLYRFFFTKESIFWWVWDTYDRRKTRFEQFFNEMALSQKPQKMIRLKSHREMKVFIETISRSKKLIEKVQAYVVRKKLGKLELLVLKHPIRHSVEVVRGTVESNESLEEAMIRELHEEAGITLQSAPKRFAWGSRFLQGGEKWDGPWEHQLRHAFHFDGSEIEKDSWTHEVTGGEVENGLKFKFFWMPLDQLDSAFSVGSRMFISDLTDYLEKQFNLKVP